MRQQRGFTLIELAVTITVMAILLALVAPGMQNWFDGARIRNAAASMQDGLQRARAEAIRRNQRMSFWLVSTTDPTVMDNNCALSSTSGSWVVSADSPAGGCASAPSTTATPMLVTAHPVGDGARGVVVKAVTNDGSPANTVTFDGFGRLINAESAIGQIDITGANATAGSNDGPYRNLRVVVSAAGQPALCDPHVSDATDPRKCP